MNVYNCLLPENVMPPLEAGLHNGVHLFVVIRLLMDGISYCLTMIGHKMSMVSKNCSHNIVSRICLYLKRLLEVE